MSYSEFRSSGSSFATARTERARYEALLAKLSYETKSGELIEKSKATVSAFNTARKLRDGLMVLPDRLSPIIAGMTDRGEIRALLLGEIEQLCGELPSGEKESEWTYLN